MELNIHGVEYTWIRVHMEKSTDEVSTHGVEYNGVEYTWSIVHME